MPDSDMYKAVENMCFGDLKGSKSIQNPALGQNVHIAYAERE